MNNKEQYKEGLEAEMLSRYLVSDSGKNWLKKYDIIISSYKHSKPPAPDFIFQSKDGRKIGLEIVRFIAKTENGEATQVLKSIGNKVCCYAKRKYNLMINITITPYDRRKFSPKWSDHIDLHKNPGFSKKFKQDDLQPKIQQIIDENTQKIGKGCLVTEWVDSCDESLKIDILASKIPYCHANNAGWCLKDPFEDIQYEIDKKNNKITKYLDYCNECHLLVVMTSAEEGSYCWFTKDINEVKFKHKFKSLQFYKAHFNLVDLY